MPDSQEPPKYEYSNTYFVQDRQNEKELTRLAIQDHMLTAAMGGILPEQPAANAIQRVLDIGCGTGGWAIEAAQAYPTMSLAGIDISSRMIEYARQQAKTHQVAERVEFRVMDALLILEFPPDYFDLVNMRLGVSFLRTWEWPKLLSEIQRVARPGGIARIVEGEIVYQSSSPALLQLWEMLHCALFQAGHYFKLTTDGIAAHVAPLLTQHGYQNVQTKTYALKYQAQTAEWQAFFDDTALGFQTLRPFIQRRGCLSQDYDAIYRQALAEMQQPDFHATWNFLTTWGTVH